MSKMIAVLDNINDCFGCPLCMKIDGTCWKCSMAKIYMGGLDLTKRPHFCPLKELPERKEGFGTDSLYLKGKIDGWNYCLAEILGE